MRLHVALLGLWALGGFFFSMTWFWLRFTPGGATGDGAAVWALGGLAVAALAILPILGLILMLRGHGWGGALLAVVCAFPLLWGAAGFVGLLGRGRVHAAASYVPVALFAAFLATNVWAGVRVALRRAFP